MLKKFLTESRDGKRHRRKRGRCKEGDKDAERFDFNGVADSHEHIGYFGCIVVSSLSESSVKGLLNKLCQPIETNWYSDPNVCQRSWRWDALFYALGVRATLSALHQQQRCPCLPLLPSFGTRSRRGHASNFSKEMGKSLDFLLAS